MDSEKQESYHELETIEIIYNVKEIDIQEYYGKKSAVCDHCGKSFLNTYTLSAHRNQVHYGIKSFQCEICNASFATIYKLRRHHLGVHSDKRDFHCDVCGLSFKTRDMVLKHQRTHATSTDQFNCDECNRKFKYKSGLDYHLRLKHKTLVEIPESKPNLAALASIHECHQCQKVFSTQKTLNRHMKVHDGSLKITCQDEKCGMMFSSTKNLQKHKKLKHSTIVMFTCSYCKKEYKSKQNFEIHIASHEVGDEMEDYEYLNEEIIEETEVIVEEAEEQLLELRSSGIPEDLLRNIDGDMVSIKKIVEEDEDEFQEQGYDNPVKIEQTEVEAVRIEENNMETFTEIEVHNYIVDERGDEMDFYETIISEDLEPSQLNDNGDLETQDTCCYALEIPEEMLEDIKPNPKMSSKTRSICHECGSTFQNNSHLKRHQQRKHQKNEHKLECDICGSKFLLAYDLKRHMIKHSSKREFVCSGCNKEFKTESTLRSHFKVVHSDTERSEKNYKCQICDRSYFHQRHLEYHMRKHTEDLRYSCNQCVPEKFFHYADAVKWHEIRHHGKPAPFRCSFVSCNKIFIHERSLHTHEKEHNPESGSLSVECPVCKKLVSEKRHLKRHMRSHISKGFQCKCGLFFKERFQFTKHKQACQDMFTLNS